MPTPRPSVLKRQREQAKKEKHAAKAEKRAQRKVEGDSDPMISDEVVREESWPDNQIPS
jgi:hypothetical protein